MTRREMIAGAATTSALTPEARIARSAPSRPTVDAHAHLFHRGLKLADVRRYAPSYDALVGHYLDELDACDVSHGAIIQPSFLGVDNSFLVDCVAAAKGRLRAVAVVEPTIPFDELRRLRDAGVVGVRLNLIGKPTPDMAAPEWRTHLAALARLGWQVEVQAPAAVHATLAPTLLDSGVSVVLDHFGLPDPTLGVDDPGFRKILTLGATRRLWVKLSAAYRLGPDGEALAARAYNALKRDLGLDRLVWGSDWPHTQNEATQTFAKNRAFFATLVPDLEDQAMILRNGDELFQF